METAAKAHGLTFQRESRRWVCWTTMRPAESFYAHPKPLAVDNVNSASFEHFTSPIVDNCSHKGYSLPGPREEHSFGSSKPCRPLDQQEDDPSHMDAKGGLRGSARSTQNSSLATHRRASQAAQVSFPVTRAAKTRVSFCRPLGRTAFGEPWGRASCWLPPKSRRRYWAGPRPIQGRTHPPVAARESSTGAPRRKTHPRSPGRQKKICRRPFWRYPKTSTLR